MKIYLLYYILSIDENKKPERNPNDGSEVEEPEDSAEEVEKDTFLEKILTNPLLKLSCFDLIKENIDAIAENSKSEQYFKTFIENFLTNSINEKRTDIVKSIAEWVYKYDLKIGVCKIFQCLARKGQLDETIFPLIPLLESSNSSYEITFQYSSRQGVSVPRMLSFPVHVKNIIKK